MCRDAAGFGESIPAGETGKAVERQPALFRRTLLGQGDLLGAAVGALRSHKPYPPESEKKDEALT